MSVGQAGESEPDRTDESANRELRLATTATGDAKAWNAGLLLGVVSELCHAMRFDPTTTSTRQFRHYSSLLQSAACLLVETIPLREAIVTGLAEFVHEMDGCYGTEWHAELLSAWRRGDVDSDNLRISTCEPPDLACFQQSIEQIIPDCDRLAFLAGFTCGNAWAHCRYQLRDDVPSTTLSQVFVAPTHGSVSSASSDFAQSEFQLEPEFGSRVSAMFHVQGWSLDEWRCAMFRVGHQEGEWNQFGALTAGIDWISWRITSNDQFENEHVANPAEDDDQESGPRDTIAQPPASEGFINADYLGISYSELARAVRRNGFDIPLRFEGRLLPWHLFWILVRHRAQWTSRETLRTCWQLAGRSEPETNADNVIDRAISDLRDIVRVLDLQVTNRPRIGWRLDQL